MTPGFLNALSRRERRSGQNVAVDQKRPWGLYVIRACLVGILAFPVTLVGFKEALGAKGEDVYGGGIWLVATVILVLWAWNGPSAHKSSKR